jgi:hypothetical protein
MNKSTLVASILAMLCLALAAFSGWQVSQRTMLEGELVTLGLKLAAREQAAQLSARAQQAREALRNTPDAASERRAPAAEPAVPTVAPARAPAAAAATVDASTTVSIMKYLGDPVRPPSTLDPKYTAEGLASSFAALCQSRGVKVQQFAVDTSEFPFLVYGLLEGGREFFRQIDAELKTVPGYVYGGSVVGSTRDGSTYFSLNMTPRAAYPGSDAEAIQRRMMIRLQMLGVIWTDPKP